MRRPFLSCAALLLLALAGCTLIDQTTFAPSPEATTRPAPPPPKMEARAPLIVISFASAPPDYADPLRQAVRAAQARKPDIIYDVVGVAPARGDAVAQADGLLVSSDNASAVMRALIADGVPAARIHLGARTEAGLTAREVRVYVR
jgi:ABC-type glycerol-3-phosphate transport system substrate-binding protein